MLTSEDDMVALFAKYDIDEAAFREAYNSFGVSSAVKRAENLTRRYGGRRDITTTSPKVKGSTVSATVEFDDPFWHLDEYGSINSPAVAPLRGAAADCGIRVRES